jgi:hypothetical protein
MPYDVFKHSDKYTNDESDRPRVKKPSDRAQRPVSEWTVKDVITEFRAQYRARYPQHSPDELGNFVTISKILGKLRKEGYVTVEHMHASIEGFWQEGLDKRRPDVPAWQKWLWKVRDTRPKRADQFYAKQVQSEVRPKPEPLPFSNEPTAAETQAKYIRVKAELDQLESLLESGGPDELRLLLGDNWSTMLNYKRDRVASLQRRMEEK